MNRVPLVRIPYMSRSTSSRALAMAALLVLGVTSAHAQMDARVMQDLRWRCIGPFRGGRTVAATGVPGEPHTFLIGVNHGGVWHTNDAGRTWRPIFDDQPTGVDEKWSPAWIGTRADQDVVLAEVRDLIRVHDDPSDPAPCP